MPAAGNNGRVQSPPGSPRSPTIADATVHADIDYESDPAAVAQEISNLQALRRMSMDVTTSVSDPDLPSFGGAPGGGGWGVDEGGGAGDASLLWVPARYHPELNAQGFESFLEMKKNEIRRGGQAGSGGLGVDQGKGLRRKKSMLSRQVTVDGGSGRESNEQLEEFLNDTELLEKISECCHSLSPSPR